METGHHHCSGNMCNMCNMCNACNPRVAIDPGCGAASTRSGERLASRRHHDASSRPRATGNHH
ncbi:hypothetical protein M758_7G131400 [Ceratodon purpureus]|nr:hypothetical protein M758_7G131400 [Ceratodon purpureus]